jgi:serine/threonine protein kinase
MLHAEGVTLSAQFEVQQRFRCGSFSELYLARNAFPKPGEPENVVVKALNVRLRGEPEAEFEKLLVGAFQSEAIALKECEHENIVRLIQCGAATDKAGKEFHYLALEYLPGGNLKDLLQRGRIELESALSLLGQISQALSCIHQKGLVHRDIKPANVMLSSDLQQAKLIDLGTVRWLDDDSQITEVGTPVYAAPEHYSPGRAVESLTVAADVYAFAKTSYALLSGKEPTGLNQQQIADLPDCVRREAWAMPTLRVLMKATNDVPAARHQTVAEFFRDLLDATEVTTYKGHDLGKDDVARELGKSRFVVDVTPIPEAPSVAPLVIAQILTLAAWVRLVARRGCLRIVDDYLIAVGNLKIVNVKIYAVVGAIVLFGLCTPLLGPTIVHLSRRLLPSRAVVVEPKPDQTNGLLRAMTDVNIRESPKGSAQKTGLVENESLVRVLRKSQSQKWCEIEIVTHGRPKIEASVSDRGWVACEYLTPV